MKKTKRTDSIRSLSREARDAALKRGHKTLYFTYFGSGKKLPVTAIAMEAEMRHDISKWLDIDIMSNWPRHIVGTRLATRINNFIRSRKPPMPEWAKTALEHGWTPPNT